MSAQLSHCLFYLDASKTSKAEMQRNVYQLDKATVHGEPKVGLELSFKTFLYVLFKAVIQ